MANIKFSDFTVGNTEGDIDFVVGYKGANNIQISPTNLLASALGNYLPLAGGTMTGDLEIIDNIQLQMGNGLDFRLYHDATNSIMSSGTGDLYIQNTADDKDIIFRSDDGSGSVATYFYLDGSGTRTIFEKLTRHNDNVYAAFGSDSDLRIVHDGSDSFINQVTSATGHLYIQQFVDNKDIIFKCDDGSGGITTYFKCKGDETVTQFVQNTNHQDNAKATFGTGLDLEIYHDTSDSYVTAKGTGDLIIQNTTDDGDVKFLSDNGSGGTATYFFLDGSLADGTNTFTKFVDNSWITMGNGGDLLIGHQATSSKIENYTGPLYIVNKSDDQDIIFQSDDGSGGVENYIQIDGSEGRTTFNKTIRLNDVAILQLGNDADLRLYHNGTNSNIENFGGDVQIIQNVDDGDIIFKSDDGSGGTTEYFKLDGSSKRLDIADSIPLCFGAGDDLQIQHNGSTSYIQNFTGNLIIENNLDDGDIIFKSDDGSGSTTEYFRVDGGSTLIAFSKPTFYGDGVKALFGNSSDLNIYHNGTNSLIENSTGDFYISNKHDDGDIIFFCDDGSGGTAQYFRVDGGAVETRFLKSTLHFDNVKAKFGDGGDLEIYHDGSNSYIKDTGTGFLNIQSDAALVLANGAGEPYFIGTSNGSVKLYYDNSTKFETTSTGIKISGVSEYADNTAALAGGLTTGDVYRTGDLLKIVH